MFNIYTMSNFNLNTLRRFFIKWYFLLLRFQRLEIKWRGGGTFTSSNTFRTPTFNRTTFGFSRKRRKQQHDHGPGMDGSTTASTSQRAFSPATTMGDAMGRTSKWIRLCFNNNVRSNLQSGGPSPICQLHRHGVELFGLWEWSRIGVRRSDASSWGSS